jgi:hypothetical protein
LLVKKTLFVGVSCLGWIHDWQLRWTGPSEKPSSTMFFINISLLCSFSTKTAPTFPKFVGNSNVASYWTSFSFFSVSCAFPFIVSISEFVSSFIYTQKNVKVIKKTNTEEPSKYFYEKVYDKITTRMFSAKYVYIWLFDQPLI